MSELMDKKSTDSFSWVDWMVAEREKKGWSQADLARESELTRTTISDYEQRQRPNPDIKALVKISTALGHSPLYLPRLARLIPAEESTDEETEDIIHAVKDFTPEEKQEILSYINYQRNQRKKRG